MIFYTWDTFEPISTKTVNYLNVNANNATVIYRDNIVRLLNANKCPYGHLQECYVVFELTIGDDQITTWHAPVEYAHLPAFNGSNRANIIIDYDSCQYDTTSETISFNLVSDRAEPFVWIESSSGVFDDNLLLVNQPKTKFRLSSSKLDCSSIKSSLRIFHPSMVSSNVSTLE